MADLTTLENVKESLGIPTLTTTYDALLGRLITAQSQAIETYIGQPVISQAQTETRNGTGTREMALKYFPVTAITEVKVDDIVISESILSTNSGYRRNGRMLSINGSTYNSRTTVSRFTRGFNNVEFSYTAGYSTVPADIEQVCIDMVSFKYGTRTKKGIKRETNT